MPKANSEIKCVKCGHQHAVVKEQCDKCAAPLAKFCGTCGFANSVPKNYCDQCGELLVLAPPRPQNTEPPRPAQPLPPADAPLPREKTAPAKKRGPAVAAGLSLAVILIPAYILLSPQFPKFQLTLTCRRYLKELSSGRYENAYKMLSKNSKQSCPVEDYVNFSRQYYSQKSWEFKDVKPFVVEKDAALVKYQIKEGTSPWKDDFISFVWEDGKWARPYIWNFFQRIEEAIGKNDPSHALFLAQRLYLTDPLDPRTSGYLCWTEYLMGLYDKAANDCKKAMDSSRFYPVGFTSEAVFWFHYQLADSLRNTKKYAEALDEYNKLLADEFSAQNRCDILTGRADIYVWLNRYDAALQDMLEARDICPQTAQKNVSSYLSYLTGDAKELSVALAQKARRSAGEPRLFDIRRENLETLRKKLGKKAVLPKDIWISAHMRGPIYKVILKQEGGKDSRGNRLASKDIYRLTINLWNSSVKLDYSDKGE